jgi:type I restriction enzyme S subunit
MGSEWTPSTLGDDVDLLTGFPFKSSEYVTDSDGIKLLRGDNVVQGSLRWDGVKLWSPKNVDGLQQYQLDERDVVLAMDRPWIEAGLKYAATSEHDLPCLLVQRVARLRGSEVLDGGYLRYLIGSRAFTEHVLAVQTGTAVPHISGSQIKAFRYQRPPLEEQQAIACILGALDDKIELNRRRNRTLEAMARAIFQSWFVDFDPVKAKAAGRTPPGLSPALAALFPDSFTDSPLGPIPTGWRVGSVGDILSLSRDAILPGDYADEVFDHYSIPAYDAGQNPSPESGSTIKSQKFIVSDDCVLVSKLNPKTPRVWIPEVDRSRRRIASTEFLVCRPKASSGLGRAYFYCLACDSTFSEHLTSRASGTSNSHQRVRPQDFLSYEIPLPAAGLACAFNDKVEPILDRVLLLKKQSRTLAALRDALLPKLISGELRVPDAERIVGRAV